MSVLYYVHSDLFKTVKVCRSLSEAERNVDQFCRVVQIEPTSRNEVMTAARKICKQFDCLLRDMTDGPRPG